MSKIPPSTTSRDRRERASHPGVRRIRDETVRGDFRAMRGTLRVKIGGRA